MKPEQLASAVSAQTLKPAYLIAGPEFLKVMEAADAIRAAARAAGVDGRDVFDAAAKDFEWQYVENAVGAMGLFSSTRLVEVTVPTGKPGKEGAAMIEAYCANPPPGTTLVILAHEWSNKHSGKWSDAIARVGVVSIAWALKPHEFPDWISKRMRARKVQATQGAIEQLALRTEGNLLAAAQEVDKLALLAGGEMVDEARMESYVADAARFDVFRLLDAALNGDAPMVSRMIAGLQAEGTAIQAMLGMVVMEVQRLTALAVTQARGGNMAQEFKAHRIWDSKQAQYKRALARYPAAKWQGLLSEIGRLDRASKGRAGDDPWLLLERVLLAVAEPRANALLRVHA